MSLASAIRCDSDEVDVPVTALVDATGRVAQELVAVDQTEHDCGAACSLIQELAPRVVGAGKELLVEVEERLLLRCPDRRDGHRRRQALDLESREREHVVHLPGDETVSNSELGQPLVRGVPGEFMVLGAVARTSEVRSASSASATSSQAGSTTTGP